MKLHEMEGELRLDLEAVLSENLKMKLMYGDNIHGDNENVEVKYPDLKERED